MAAPTYDVIVVGGGPAGSTLAWALAKRGVHVLVLERTRFPREKVCGDFVEPRGLRILRELGCLNELERGSPPPVSRLATFVDGVCRWADEIPFYGVDENLPPHGYVIARDRLDTAMLEAAERAGATVHQETLVTNVDASSRGVRVEGRRNRKAVRHRARLVAGADGVNSVVAMSAGVLVDDERRTAVAQRAYATGVEVDFGEASFFFDESFFPGYGWVFPMAGGRVNLGVGVLSETRRRLGLNVPVLFQDFVERLRRSHAGCAAVELCSAPIGGIVRTYGAAGANHFDGGVLVGDAGGFVDPMTGEGITTGAESSLLAAPALQAALEAGRFDSSQLSAYEHAFRAYFDPAMMFLDLCAATLRNRYLARPWLKALGRGCDLAQRDPTFALAGGSYFGGLHVQPYGILAHLWTGIAKDLVLVWPRLLTGFARGEAPGTFALGDLLEWQVAWSRSFIADPFWHTRWAQEVQRKALRVLSSLDPTQRDPRAAGLLD